MKGGRKSPRRQIFVLTPDEKRAAACVLGAFLLGLATMQYRATYPRPPPAPTAKEQQAEKKRAAAEKRAAGRRSPARAASPVRTPADPGLHDLDEE